MERQRTRPRASHEGADAFDSDDAELIRRDAAQLQAEAARQLQERSIEIAARTGGDFTNVPTKS